MTFSGSAWSAIAAAGWLVGCAGSPPAAPPPTVPPPAVASRPAPVPSPIPPEIPSHAVAATLDRLAQPGFDGVLAARNLLLADRAASLAGLVAMVERDDVVPLVDTADLIYPGAKQFYGHGWIVPYDLDHLGDRAAWLLEEITFRDFGFSHGVNARHRADPTQIARRSAARAAVREWWETARHGWRCYEALAEALRGDATQHAYQWLRDWSPPGCDGFTATRFRRELLPIVKRHAADPDHPQHEKAQYLLRDVDEMPRFKLR
jgi:hypothetical protein